MPFSKDNRPKLPDSYFNFTTTVPSVVAPNGGSTVAIPIIHDWGPFKVAKTFTSFAQFQATFGYSTDTPGYLAVKQAFIGEGLSGRGGAGAVLVYRFGASAAAAATKTLSNTSEPALKITAKYLGTRGNDLRLTVRTNVTVPTNTDLLVLDGTTELESYTFVSTEVGKAAEFINKHSNWVVAEKLKDGVKLAVVTAQALTGGNDGETPVAEDWTKMLAAISLEQFAYFAPYNLTEVSIQETIKAWVIELNELKNKRFIAVFGGSTSDSITTAIERSEKLAAPEVVNIGIGKFLSLGMGPENGNIEISTSQLAPRIAGILAQKGEYAAMTYARLAGLEIVSGPSDSEIARAYDAGIVVLARDDDPEAGTFIKVGHSTWTETNAQAALTPLGEPLRPYFIYREPKYVRTMQGVQTDLTAYFRREILGVRPVNDDTRDAVVSEAKSLLTERERLGVIQPGWTVGIDQSPPPSDDDEFVALVMSLKFGRALKQVFVTLTVG